MTVRLGIIGFGRIGKLHVQWLREARGIEAVAASDPTEARRAMAREAGLRVFNDNAQLLEDPNIDAVVIATPTSMHFDHAMSALRAGKHLMVEKPMTIELDQARQLVEEAENRKHVLSVFHNRRWDRDLLTLKHAIDSGVFGKVINVESRLGQWQSCVGPAAVEWRPQWRNEAGFGGGGLLDWGSHFLDQIWRLMHPARPVRVFAQLRGNVWTVDCDDLARVCIDFDSGAVALVEINTTTTQPLARWHIDGTNGSASSPFSLTYDPQSWSDFRFKPSNGGDAIALPPCRDGLSPTQIWEQFAKACSGDGEAAVTARSVLPTVALLDAARRSSVLGSAIEVREVVDWQP